MKDPAQFEHLRSALAAFSDEALTMQDYECAAEFFLRCRGQGVQGSNTDFLICTVATQRKLPIFSLDKDFVHFQKSVSLELFALPQ